MRFRYSGCSGSSLIVGGGAYFSAGAFVDSAPAIAREEVRRLKTTARSMTDVNGARDVPARSSHDCNGIVGIFRMRVLHSDLMRAGTSRAPFIRLLRKVSVFMVIPESFLWQKNYAIEPG